MEILQLTDDHAPTFMRDVFTALVGKDVIVFAQYAITGKLVTYNGYVLHVHDDADNKNYYISAAGVEAIAEKEKYPLEC